MGKRVAADQWGRTHITRMGTIYGNIPGKGALVDGWSETEDRSNVIAQLTPELLDEVLTETTNRRKGQYWLRVTVPSGVHAADIQQAMENSVGIRLPVTRRDGQQFVIQCMDTRQVQTLLQ